MIYRIENGQKVALDAMLDNSWEIEYDRNLISSINGKSEWIATEDCWFQYDGVWVREKAREDKEGAALQTLKILLNGVEVSTLDRSPTTGLGSNEIMTRLLAASVLMKKGDVIKITRATIEGQSDLTFSGAAVRCFPIHKILSPRENVVTATLQLQANSGSINGKYTVSLYPLGNDIYLFCLPTGGIQFRPWSTDVASLFFSIEGFDMLDLKLDYWQVATGIPDYVGTTSNNTDPSQWIACVRPSNTEWNIFMRGHGIIRRR